MDSQAYQEQEVSDHGTIEAISKRITETVYALQALVPSYALARQVIDYDSDRRKIILATGANILLQQGVSATAADTTARASKIYAEELDKLAKELKSAYEVQAKWQALMARLDAARSLLSMEKETLNKMPETIGT